MGVSTGADDGDGRIEASLALEACEDCDLSMDGVAVVPESASASD